MRLIHTPTGKQLAVSHEATTFRGEKVVITGIYPPGTASHAHGTGRVEVEWEANGHRQLLFPSVINAEFVE